MAAVPTSHTYRLKDIGDNLCIDLVSHLAQDTKTTQPKNKFGIDVVESTNKKKNKHR